MFSNVRYQDNIPYLLFSIVLLTISTKKRVQFLSKKWIPRNFDSLGNITRGKNLKNSNFEAYFGSLEMYNVDVGWYE